MLLQGRARISVKTQQAAPQSAETALCTRKKHNTAVFLVIELSLSEHFNFQGLCCLVYFGKGRMALEDSGGCFLWAEDVDAKEGRTIS